MQENLLSYDFIVDYFGKETISDRYKYLYDKMQEYINARGLQDCLAISEDILQAVVMDYFTDIYRLKAFHKIENINMFKIISYEIYWILRRKPIQLNCNVKQSKRIFPNEGFATTFLAHECLVPEDAEPMDKEKEEAYLKYLQHINYHFKYRSIDKKCLELMLYSFATGKYINAD